MTLKSHRLLISVSIFLSLMGCATTKTMVTNNKPELKLVSFDEFMNYELSKSIPISFLIPADYIHVDLNNVDATYSYWMRKEKEKESNKTNSLPVDTGWMYGKLSFSIGYDEQTDQFLGTEKNQVVGLEVITSEGVKNGFKNFVYDRFEVAGYPIYTLEMEHEETSKKIYSMYISMKLDTHVIYIAYREPKNKTDTGRYVWDSLISSLRHIENKPQQ